MFRFRDFGVRVRQNVPNTASSPLLGVCYFKWRTFRSCEHVKMTREGLLLAASREAVSCVRSTWQQRPKHLRRCSVEACSPRPGGPSLETNRRLKHTREERLAEPLRGHRCGKVVAAWRSPACSARLRRSQGGREGCRGGPTRSAGGCAVPPWKPPVLAPARHVCRRALNTGRPQSPSLTF